MSNGLQVIDADHVASEAAARAGAPQHVKRVMEALTRLLVGKKGDPRGAAFDNNVMIIVGAPLSTTGLLWLADIARLNREHVIHLAVEPVSNIPTIALAYQRGDTVEVFESCMLCLRPGEDRVTIVPDSFERGAFQFAPDIKLKQRKAPPSFDAAMPIMVRAYHRFNELLAANPADDWEPIRVTGR